VSQVSLHQDHDLQRDLALFTRRSSHSSVIHKPWNKCFAVRQRNQAHTLTVNTARRLCSLSISLGSPQL